VGAEAAELNSTFEGGDDDVFAMSGLHRRQLVEVAGEGGDARRGSGLDEALGDWARAQNAFSAVVLGRTARWAGILAPP